MRMVLRILTLVLVCAMVLGGVLPVAASSSTPAIAQDGDSSPTPSSGEPTADLGVIPGVVPQPGSVVADAGLDVPASAQADVALDGAPSAVGIGSDPAAFMAEVPAEEYGVDPNVEPQFEPLVVSSWLYLPAIRGAKGVADQAAAAGEAAPAAMDGTVYASGARSADGANVTKTVFNVGNTIRYIGTVYNSTGLTRSIYGTWLLSGPCGTSTLWAGWLNVVPAYSQWYVQGTAPNCPGAYTFTFRVNFAGYVTQRSSTFTVNSPGNVTVSSVATQDSAGAAKTSFALGSFIRYAVFLNNTTNAARSVYLTYSLAGPCGAGTLWAGNVTTPIGIGGWGLDRTVPNCAGTYTYTARVTYNGYTTARSTTFTVFAPATVAVTAVRTADRYNNTRTIFGPGALMRYIGTLSNNTGATRSAYTVWSISGPGCTGNLWAGYLNVAPGSQEWYVDGVAPGCWGSYTFSLSVTYNGVTTTRSSTFTVQ